jgi:hypothetical protein
VVSGEWERKEGERKRQCLCVYEREGGGRERVEEERRGSLAEAIPTLLKSCLMNVDL